MTVLKCYIIDTGWLLEFFRVDEFYKEETHETVKSRIEVAIQNKARMYVPVPVLFETATKIAQIKHAINKKTISDKFVSTVKLSINESNPWIITHPTGNQNVQDLLDALDSAIQTYSDAIQNEAFSLVDVVVLQEADRIKEENKDRNTHVHIWSTEDALKAREPDKE